MFAYRLWTSRSTQTIKVLRLTETGIGFGISLADTVHRSALCDYVQNTFKDTTCSLPAANSNLSQRFPIMIHSLENHNFNKGKSPNAYEKVFLITSVLHKTIIKLLEDRNTEGIVRCVVV